MVQERPVELLMNEYFIKPHRKGVGGVISGSWAGQSTFVIVLSSKKL
jgi:hypothetical protein